MNTRMQPSAPIRGIFTPNIVPLKDDGSINELELRRYVRWLIDHGVHGLYPNGSTGEFTRYTVEERKLIVRAVCEECSPKNIPVLAGAAEANVSETIAACECYLGYGARAVAIVVPFYFRASQEGVYAYFADIARSSPIDITLYNIPALATPIEVDTVRRLAEEFPRVVGIKDSSGDVSQMARLISRIRPMRPDFSFLTGWEAVLVPMMLLGADGGTHATSGVMPELTRRLYDLAIAQRYQEAIALQFRLIELFDLMLLSADFPDGFRMGVELRGFRVGLSRQPLSERQRDDRTRLKMALRRLMDEFGVA
ncbi:MAG: dihydrodipicolinate synthase family protein [Phycisphaerae bacterium]